jgi:hypothetical protein
VRVQGGKIGNCPLLLLRSEVGCSILGRDGAWAF